MPDERELGLSPREDDDLEEEEAGGDAANGTREGLDRVGHLLEVVLGRDDARRGKGQDWKGVEGRSN